MATPARTAFAAPLALPARVACAPARVCRISRRSRPRLARMSLVHDILQQALKSGVLPKNVASLPAQLHAVLQAAEALESAAAELAALAQRGSPASRKWTKLVFCLGIDLIGAGSLPVPMLADVLDVAWAPLAALILHALFASPLVTAAGFAEEILPGTDGIPTASLAWIMEHYGGALRAEWATERVRVVSARPVTAEEAAGARAASVVRAPHHTAEANAQAVQANYGVAVPEVDVWEVAGAERRRNAVDAAFRPRTARAPLYRAPASSSAHAYPRVHALLAAPETAVAGSSPERELTAPATAKPARPRSRAVLRVHLWRWEDVRVLRDASRLAAAAAPGALLAPGPSGALARAQFTELYAEIVRKNWATHDAAVEKLLGERVLRASRMAVEMLAARRRADVRRREELRDAIAGIVLFDDAQRRDSAGRRRVRKLQTAAGEAAVQFTAALFALVGALFPDREQPLSVRKAGVALAVSKESVHTPGAGADKREP